MVACRERALSQLRRRLPPEIFADDPWSRHLHATDATNRPTLPAAIVRPRDREELLQAVRMAVDLRLPIVARGAGTGFSGGALSDGGIVLDLLGLDRIIDIDQRERIAVVEPGVVNHDLQQAAAAVGLFYAPDPASHRLCTLGGNAAENAGGPRCLKYGVTGDWVAALDAIDGTGRAFRAGKPLAKDRTGYDLKRLLIGSEGTLAIFSRLWLRLQPAPESRFLVRADFSQIETAARLVGPILADGIQPAAMEFMDASALAAVATAGGIELAPAVQAVLLIEVDGPADELPLRRRRLLAHLQPAAITVEVAESPAAIDALWEIRRRTSPAMHHFGDTKINEDIVVPVSTVPAVLAAIRQLSEQHRIPIICFGHIGDGNIHVNIMAQRGLAASLTRANRALAGLFALVNQVGGAISGEHGIGSSKRAWLPGNLDPVALALMRDIKDVFDPHRVLNPGKIFARRSTRTAAAGRACDCKMTAGAVSLPRPRAVIRRQPDRT